MPLVNWAPPPCQQRAGCSCPGAHRWWPGAAVTSLTMWCVSTVTGAHVSPVARRSASSQALQTCGKPRLSLLTWILISTTRSLWRLTAVCPNSVLRGSPRASLLLWTIQVSSFTYRHFSFSFDLTLYSVQIGFTSSLFGGPQHPMINQIFLWFDCIKKQYLSIERGKPFPLPQAEFMHVVKMKKAQKRS